MSRARPKKRYINFSERGVSYTSLLNTGHKEIDIVRMCEILFRHANWIHGYGGAAWADVAKGWMKLHNAKELRDMLVWIDHVYDLQHNNGTVFNKLESYYKKGYEWLKRALDHKKEITDPWELWHRASPTMQKIAAFTIKQKWGTTLEDFLKNGPQKRPQKLEWSVPQMTINEAIWNVKYKMPKDKEERLYDFYLLFLIKGNFSGGKVRVSADATRSEQVDWLLQNVAETLLPSLKKSLLQAVLYSMSAEIRHVFVENSEEDILHILPADLQRVFEDYADEYGAEYGGDIYTKMEEVEGKYGINHDYIQVGWDATSGESHAYWHANVQFYFPKENFKQPLTDEVVDEINVPFNYDNVEFDDDNDDYYHIEYQIGWESGDADDFEVFLIHTIQSIAIDYDSIHQDIINQFEASGFNKESELEKYSWNFKNLKVSDDYGEIKVQTLPINLGVLNNSDVIEMPKGGYISAGLDSGLYDKGVSHPKQSNNPTGTWKKLTSPNSNSKLAIFQHQIAKFFDDMNKNQAQKWLKGMEGMGEKDSYFANTPLLDKISKSSFDIWINEKNPLSKEVVGIMSFQLNKRSENASGWNKYLTWMDQYWPSIEKIIKDSYSKTIRPQFGYNKPSLDV